jgi:putative ATPase
MAAQQAVHFLGMPEGELALAEAVVYLCFAPKSNSVYRAYGAVKEDVARTRNEPVPLHIRNAPTRLMKGLGYGKGYKYAHDYEDARVEQDHLPDALRGRRYYFPTDRGHEARIGQRIEEWRQRSGEKPARGDGE